MALDDAGLDLLFREAHTQHGWLDEPVSADQMRALYDLFKWAPTTSNSNPARFVFVMSREGKERLKPALNPTNVEKTMTAPVTVIVASDTRFYEYMPALYPPNPKAGERFADPANQAAATTTALRNGSLQGAYLIIAARALGLGCGPLSGFDNARVDAEFFPDGRWKSNFLCNIGYGDPAKERKRNARLDFDVACRIV